MDFKIQERVIGKILDPLVARGGRFPVDPAAHIDLRIGSVFGPEGFELQMPGGENVVEI